MDNVPAPARASTYLQLAGTSPKERRDAARNRQKIIAAASRLLRETGPAGLSPDDVAREAGVGVGTVYRRFGDRTGLIDALLDDGERRFQAGFMSGPPPLGPGAPAAERLRAFLHALIDRVEEQSELLLLTQAGGSPARYRQGPYRIYHVHVVTLLRQLSPDADHHYLADALLAPVSPGLLVHQRRDAGFGVERIKAGVDRFLDWALHPGT